MNYTIKYSNRKTVGIYVKKGGTVEVRSPRFVTKLQIQNIVETKLDWINKTIKRILDNSENELNNDDKEELIKKAKEIIPRRVDFFSNIMGVKPSSIKIGNAKSYWGCCSAKNGLIFSWRLMKASSEAVDYVVVHELAHIKEHNHSKKFWNEVEKVIPEYKVYIVELNKFRVV